MLRLLDRQPRPTAIFAANLVFITGILRALAANDIRCPGEIEVMASDDAEWLDVFQPRISTVIQPSYEVGVKAAELLLKRIRHPKRPFQTILLEPQLRAGMSATASFSVVAFAHYDQRPRESNAVTFSAIQRSSFLHGRLRIRRWVGDWVGCCQAVRPSISRRQSSRYTAEMLNLV